ncbi:hypothetical protein EOM39_01280 [Candidatus Gracilibacteria bacterium]|nr:hypothetical protein [Candidatus Gracilibacteria bacterium]
MYIKQIIENIKTIDKDFTNKKEYGKIVIEINYQNGKYVCDNIKEERTNKRIIKE